MIWKHWMVLELIEIEDYFERCNKLEEFIEFMEVERKIKLQEIEQIIKEGEKWINLKKDFYG